MRIGFFSGRFLGGGSTRTAVEPLARALQRLGHEIFILELSPWRSCVARSGGLSICTLPTRWNLLHRPHLAAQVFQQQLLLDLRRRLGKPPPILEEPLAFHRFLGQLQRDFIRQQRLDVLYLMHSFNIVGLLAQPLPPELFLAVNFIGFGIDPARGGGLDTFPYQKYSFERPRWDLHVAASRFEFEQYRRVYQGLGLPSEKLLALPHSFDEDVFRPLPEPERQALRRKYALDQDELVLVYPVQVYPRKNVELAIEVAARLNRQRPATLVVTGQVYDRDYLQQLQQRAFASGLEDRVRFLKGIPVGQVAEVLNLADVCIFPSHQETFGHGLVESLGCGTPAVGPAYIHPCREVLEGMPGGWLAEKQVDDFCRQALAAVSAGCDRQLIAQQARLRYGNRALAGQWLEKVRELKEQKRARQVYLDNLDWRSLYQDQLDLMEDRAENTRVPL